MIIKDLEKQLKALSNKRRLNILSLLKERGPSAVGDIAKHIKLSLKSTSKHLLILYQANLLEREQHKLIVFYAIPKDPKPLQTTTLTLL
jgi:DNA-binding transcriptional ArsR family regulator